MVRVDRTTVDDTGAREDTAFAGLPTITAAIAALRGPDALLPLTENVLANDALAELAGKVTLSISPEFDAVFPGKTLARVTVTCGRQRFVSPVTGPKGEATNPLSWAELETKFRTATRMSATAIQQDRILGSINDVRSGDLTALETCLERLTLKR